MLAQMFKIKQKLRKNPYIYPIAQKIYHVGYITVKALGMRFRYYFIKEEKQLAYLSNFKVASSSILSVLMDKEVVDHDTVHTEARQLLKTKSILSAEEESYYSFTFVRNPYTRILSCYKNKVVKESEKDRPYFSQNMFSGLSKVASFEEFIDKICRIPDRISDAHFVSQSYFIYSKGKPVVDYVGKMETLEQDFEPVRAAFDLNPLPHYNKTTKTDWMSAYTLDTAEKVYQRYREDFKLFGYEDEHKKLLEYLTEKSPN